MKIRTHVTAALSTPLWLQLARKISPPAVLFASLLLRLLAILFDLEIRLINWLIKPGQEHSFRQKTELALRRLKRRVTIRDTSIVTTDPATDPTPGDGPTSRRCIDFVWKDAHGNRNGDVLGIEKGQLVFPIESSRGNRRAR